MSQFFNIHLDNPQLRLIQQAVHIIKQGGVIVYPTDSCYALGCQIGNKDAATRLLRVRGLDVGHDLTLVCRDLSELGRYAQVDNTQFRFLKAHTPGAYTFVLRGTREVPKRLLHKKNDTIGLRVPDHSVVQALLDELGEPLLSSTLLLPGEDVPLCEPWEIRSVALTITQHDRCVGGEIDDGRWSHSARAAIDHQLDLVFQPLADLPRLAQGDVFAGQ